MFSTAACPGVLGQLYSLLPRRGCHQNALRQENKQWGLQTVECLLPGPAGEGATEPWKGVEEA